MHQSRAPECFGSMLVSGVALTVDIYDSNKRSEIMSRVSRKDTGPEMAVRRKLHSLGLRFRLHDRRLPGRPDIVLPKYRSVIFVHGCFWHHHENCKKSKLPVSNADFWRHKILANARRDRQNISELSCLGWRVLTIWECEIAGDRFVAKLTEFLGLASTP